MSKSVITSAGTLELTSPGSHLGATRKVFFRGKPSSGFLLHDGMIE